MKRMLAESMIKGFESTGGTKYTGNTIVLNVLT